jgi:tmRNA-binding protein
MALYRLVRRYKTKLIRHKIRTVYIWNVKHQLEFLTHKINKTFYIKVYNIESGSCVDDSIQVSNWLYEKLQSEDLNYHFNIENGKLIPLDMYLERLSLKTLCQVKLFIAKLKYKVLKRRGIISNQKHVVKVSFSHDCTDLTYIIFVTSRNLGNGNYSH